MKPLSESLVLVLGLGESGLAMARWCAREGARLRVADTRPSPPGASDLARVAGAAELVLGDFDESLLDGVDVVAISPGVDLRIELLAHARGRGIPLVGELTLFAQALAARGARATTRIVAITGTNGKTTTTALTAALCRGAGMDVVAAGNISPAALSVLADRLDGDLALPQCWVLELSSFQLETMQGLEPDAAVVLNVSDDHLDRHGSLAAYAAIKAQIYAGQGVQVINRDDPAVSAMALPGRQLVTFGADLPIADEDFGLAQRDGKVWLMRGERPLLEADRMRLAGRHNHTNALAALALGEAIGCDMGCMLAALQAFAGLPHRVELVALRTDGVAFFDDSKGTNVGATVAAIEGLGRPVVLIAGGDGKGQDFSPLRQVVAAHARAVVLIGRDAARIEQALAGVAVPTAHAGSMDEAVARASALAVAGDAVLLSPACASLDMFRNYAHRAEVFVGAVLTQPGVTPR